MVLFRATQGFRVPGKTSLSLEDVADKPACAGANQNTGRIRRVSASRGEARFTASPIPVGSAFFPRTDLASEESAMIDANADPERRDPVPFPVPIEDLKFAPNGERGPCARFGVSRQAPALHVPPRPLLRHR